MNYKKLQDVNLIKIKINSLLESFNNLNTYFSTKFNLINNNMIKMENEVELLTKNLNLKDRIIAANKIEMLENNKIISELLMEIEKLQIPNKNYSLSTSQSPKVFRSESSSSSSSSIKFLDSNENATSIEKIKNEDKNKSHQIQYMQRKIDSMQSLIKKYRSKFDDLLSLSETLQNKHISDLLKISELEEENKRVKNENLLLETKFLDMEFKLNLSSESESIIFYDSSIKSKTTTNISEMPIVAKQVTNATIMFCPKCRNDFVNLELFLEHCLKCVE